MAPLVPGLVNDGDAGDCQLAEVGGDGGLGADGAEEGVPAVGDGGRVQEGQVQGLKGAGRAAGLDTGDDGCVFGGCGLGRVGDVGETHFGWYSGVCEGGGGGGGVSW